MKKFFLVVLIAVFVWLVITAKEPEREPRDHVDPTMPRSESIFSMEVGDIEYLLWEQGR